MKLKLAISLLLIFSAAAWAGPANEKAGFIALKGAAAASFQVPADVHLMSTETSKARGLVSKRYQQMVGDADVLGGQLTVLSNASGDTVAVIGAYYPSLLSTNDIKLKGKTAQAVAASKIGSAGRWSTRLMINPSNGRYFYRVENRRPQSRWFYWIDAENGDVINAYDGLTHSNGIGVLGDTKDLTDLTRVSGTYYEMTSTYGRYSTYDAGNRNRLPGKLATDDNDLWDLAGSTSPGQGALVDAQFYAHITDAYYLLTYTFNWTNHYPQGMVSSAHLQRNYNNAYWNGEQMAYGDGDGSTIIEFSGDLDVVGHELSHGVTEATSNLIYQNESGALNEAFSDIMGTNIEFYYGTGNWTIGENITPGANGIRNMANPNEDGDPSHYADRYTGTSDNGGVHTNSGIANHWYYLLVNGGQNANPARRSGTIVQGIGIADAQTIAFFGFTTLNATADFCDARASTMAVSGTHGINVADAWDEVGVTDALCLGSNTGSSGTAPEISRVSSKMLRGTKFQISWKTDIPSTTEVTFSCCGTYTKTDLVTSHSYTFNGSKGYQYEYYVTSDDGNGNTSTQGPFYHQN